MSGAQAVVYTGSDGVARPAVLIDNRPRGGSLFVEYSEGGTTRIAYLDTIPSQLIDELHSTSARLT